MMRAQEIRATGILLVITPHPAAIKSLTGLSSISWKNETSGDIKFEPHMAG
jgi:hypothetical protein